MVKMFSSDFINFVNMTHHILIMKYHVQKREKRCFSFRWSLLPFIALIVCNLTNLIYRLFRKTSMNGVRLGFYIRIECLYIRPRSFRKYLRFHLPRGRDNTEFSVPCTACNCVKHLVQRWKQKI